MKKQPKTLAEAMSNPRFFFWPWMTSNNINEHGGFIVHAVYPPSPADVCFVEGSSEDIRANINRNKEIDDMYIRDLNTVFDYRISRGMPIMPSAKY